MAQIRPLSQELHTPRGSQKKKKSQILKKESSLVAQRVKDLALSLLWLRSLLGLGFDPWQGNFHMLWVSTPPKKKKFTEIPDKVRALEVTQPKSLVMDQEIDTEK